MKKDGNRHTIYQAISTTISTCEDIDHLKDELQKQGIQTLYKYKGQTSDLQGISFKIGHYKYKGSEVDRNFSIKNLQRTLKQQVRQLQPQASFSCKQIKQEVDHLKENNLINELIKPEQIYQQMP